MFFYAKLLPKIRPTTLLLFPLDNTNMAIGALPVPSNIRPNRIFTADKALIVKSAGQISNILHLKVVEAIVRIVTP